MTWTATIIKHNDDGLTMDVRYELAGYQPVVVGVLLPPSGAALAQHLALYAPVATWAWEDETRLPREAPAVGTSVSAPLPEPDTQPEAPVTVPTINLEPVQ